MSARHPVTTTEAPSPAGAYSQAMVAGNLVFTSGFGPQDPASGVIPDGIEAQTAQVLRNVENALLAADSGLDRILKATVHLASLEDWVLFDAVWRSVLPEPLPARTTVGSELAEILVEVDVVALRG